MSATEGAALAPAQPATPLSLMTLMVEKQVDPDALKSMMDLYERHQTYEAEKAWNAAMVAAQAEMPVVVRDAVNSHLKSKYARLESVNAAIKPVYTRHGFALTFGTEEAKVPNTIRVYADVLHAGGFCRRTVADIPLDGQGMKGGSNMNAPQAAGSTLTYGQRYVTCLAFNVTVADQDTDAVGNYVTAGQMRELTEKFDECQQAGWVPQHPDILRWLDVERYEAMHQRQFGQLIDYLDKKIKAARDKAAEPATPKKETKK